MRPRQRILGALTRPLRMLLVAFAGAFGAAPPQHVRHEDAVVQVAGVEENRE
jgi:hypothetical protein